MRYRLRIFLSLTAIAVVLLVVWELYRYGSRAEERDAWGTVTDSLRAQQARIDSLEGLLAEFDERVDGRKRELSMMQERLAQYERRAAAGRLPTPEYRAYLRAIDAHNDVVARHNEALAEMHQVYRTYSALVDLHNVLIDSANSMQRRATQEGYALPEAGLERPAAP